MAGILSVILVCKLFKGKTVAFDRPQDLFESVPNWLGNLFLGALRWVHVPTVFVLRFVARHVAFRRHRKFLTAFLVSRVALCGTGVLHPSGRFQMSAKAMAIDAVSDMGGFRGERPIFVYGHWLSQFCAKSFFSLASTKQMFGRKQRFQIGLSDSNLSDLAEYVKVGSVSLLLDMIESGRHVKLPLLKSPLKAVERITSDWNLVSRVATNRGEMSALDIQKTYLAAAESFVASVPAALHGEAPLVLRRWRELLNVVLAFRKDASDISDAIGRVDWLTKRALMDELGSDAEWASRKKVDLRYHELSSDGYHQKLRITLPAIRLVEESEIDRRRRSPPSNSPAARRGWLIREFADSDEPMQSDWGFALIGHGRQRRRVQFTDALHV